MKIISIVASIAMLLSITGTIAIDLANSIKANQLAKIEIALSE
jgi:hypothetical protein